MADHVRFSKPKTLAPPPGYSYVVEATGPCRTVYFAGQLGLDMDNKFVGEPGDFRAQCVKAHDNMTLALQAAGARWSDVVKINNYLVDILPNMATYREIRDRYLNPKAPPASTTVGVPALARPGGLFEIEAIAVLPRTSAKTARKPAAAKRGKSKRKTRGK
jgi:enamine deaminase RidA (YjgF/YER057c/UK114 family)